jgi:hypothetical protein
MGVPLDLTVQRRMMGWLANCASQSLCTVAVTVYFQLADQEFF